MQVEHLEDGSKRLTVTAELPDWVFELEKDEKERFIENLKEEINLRYWQAFDQSILGDESIIKIGE